MIINTILLAGDNVISAGWDSKIVLWTISSLKKDLEIPCDSYINILSWMDQNTNKVIAGGKNGYLILVQLWFINKKNIYENPLISLCFWPRASPIDLPWCFLQKKTSFCLILSCFDIFCEDICVFLSIELKDIVLLSAIFLQFIGRAQSTLFNITRPLYHS